MATINTVVAQPLRNYNIQSVMQALYLYTSEVPFFCIYSKPTECVKTENSSKATTSILPVSVPPANTRMLASRYNASWFFSSHIF